MNPKIKKKCSFPGCTIYVEPRKQRCPDHITKYAEWSRNYRKRQKLKQNNHA